jgi:hypothetical protein
MPSPPSYKSTTSQEELALITQNLTVHEEKELIAEPSIYTALSDDGISSDYLTGAFNATKTLVIRARGMRVIRIPIPSSEMEIPVFNTDGKLAYVSTRQKRSSGNAILSSPERGDLVASNYRFGPGKPPTLHVFGLPEDKGEIVTSSKWTSRQQQFVFAAVPITFDWRYRRERGLAGSITNKKDLHTHEVTKVDCTTKEPKEKKRTLLVLEVPEAGKKDFARIAQLVRNEETRTEGTSSSAAGNGGELMIDSAAAKAVGIPEELIVSSCILMLKKEMDRRRAMQFMMIGAGASGGT